MPMQHYPAEFLYDNLMIQSNVIHPRHAAGVEKLLFLGSSCIYPRAGATADARGRSADRELEPTNEPYAIAKIAGIKMCEAYRRQYGADFVR
jgi:GDP-L-fucose synthase